MMTDIYRPEAGHSQTFDTVTGYAGSLFLTEGNGSKVGVTVTAQDARAIAAEFDALANDIEDEAAKETVFTTVQRAIQAKAFRDERGLQSGYVVFCDFEIAGWSRDFPRPDSYEPGCVAVDESGAEWVAVGGNAYDGAEDWKPTQKEQAA